MSLDPRVDDTDGDVVLSTRDPPIGVALRHRGELTGENVCVNVPPEIPNVKAHRVEFAAGLIRHAKAGGADLSLAIYKNPEDGEWHVVVVDLEL